MEMGHIVCLPLYEPKVIWDSQGSGAAGLCTRLCVRVLYVVLRRGSGGSRRVTGGE